MEKPYIKYLEYELRTSDEISFNNPEPLVLENDEFKLTLKENVLRLTPKTHFDNIEYAKSYINEFIRSWEINFALEIGEEIEFVYRSAELENESTTKTLTDYIHISDKVTRKITLNSYQKPNSDFKASDTVVNMFYRYRLWKEDKEPLLSMAYYCLTELQDYNGRTKNKRKEASAEFKIEIGVLNKLGVISSKKGGKIPSRKASFDEITNDEIQWVKKLIPKLIKQLGKFEAGTLEDEDELTMDNLPQI